MKPLALERLWESIKEGFPQEVTMSWAWKDQQNFIGRGKG
jgi:hypothetical protein